MGTSVDWDPEQNALRWANDKPSLAKPEEEAGAVSLGHKQNRDWMLVRK
jgi:hypothetical protein